MASWDTTRKVWVCECGCGNECNFRSTYCRGHYPRTPEVIKNMKKSQLRFWSSEEGQRVASEKAKLAWKTNYQERCGAISEAKSGIPSTEDPTERSERRKKEWANPKTRLNRITALREAQAKPETKERRITTMKNKWKNPKFAEYMRTRGFGTGVKRKPNLVELKLWEDIRVHLSPDWSFNVVDGVFIGDMVPDFLNSSEKKVIEMFGNYWHDKLYFPRGKTEKETVFDYKKYGYNCTVIWEKEVRDGTSINILQKIEKIEVERLGNTKNKRINRYTD